MILDDVGHVCSTCLDDDICHTHDERLQVALHRGLGDCWPEELGQVEVEPVEILDQFFPEVTQGKLPRLMEGRNLRQVVVADIRHLHVEPVCKSS